MKILHIYRKNPDETVRVLAEAWNEENEVKEFHLYEAPVDYDALIELVFESDKVLSWK